MAPNQHEKELADAEGNFKEFSESLNGINQLLEMDPEHEGNLKLKAELEVLLAELEGQIADLKSKLEAQKQSANAKFNMDNHPAFRNKPTTTETATAPSFKVGDKVLAKWSGDRSFYAARITSISGSSASPVYVVRFDIDGTTENVRSGDVKPTTNPAHKRTADGAIVTPTPATPKVVSPKPANGSSSIISAAAHINPALATQAKKEPSKVSDGPVRPAKIPKKMKANKELESSKAKWQDWSKKGKTAKSGKPKDSMFRTPDGVNARVGFTGSGQAMRRDAERSRHEYAILNDD